MMYCWKVLVIVASFAFLALLVGLLRAYQPNASHHKADYRRFHQLHQALAEYQLSYTKATKSYYFQHSYIHDGSCVMRDTNIAMFNRQHRRQQIRRRLRSNGYACRFLQNQNTIAYNYIINVSVTSIITQHLHSSKRSTMIRKFNNATIIDEDSAIQLAGKERHHG